MHRFNGTWILDKTKNSNLSPLLSAMGRSAFEISCVSSADETFVLNLTQQTFSKKVDIYLNDSVLKLFSIFKPSITRVHYANSFPCNRQVYPHPDDQKKFGKCDALCYITDDQHIIIRWFLHDKGRIMNSDHYISPTTGQLIVTISITHFKKDTIEVVSTKVYNRQL
jgi:hypothetical protein